MIKTLASVPLFDSSYTILYATREEANKFFLAEFGVDNICTRDGSAIVISNKATGEDKLFFWASPYKDSILAIGLIAHEAVHLAKMVMEEAGVEYNPKKNDELLAKVVSYIVDDVLLFLEDSIKLPNNELRKKHEARLKGGASAKNKRAKASQQKKAIKGSRGKNKRSRKKD